jgi:HEAT repeat protein
MTETVRARLTADDPETRRLAVREVSGLDAREAGNLLLLALGDEDWRVRKEAAAAARNVSDRAQVATLLARALDDKTNIGLRNAVVEALASLGSEGVPAAIDALETLDADGRKLAVEVLARLADKDAIFALVRALEDDDPNVRVAAAEALSNARTGGDEAHEHAIRGLVSALASKETLLRLAALASLHALDARLEWSSLEELVDDPILRPHVVRLAASSPDPRAVDALAAALASPSRFTAREAAIGLSERVLADKSLAPVLQEKLDAIGAHPSVRAMFEEGDPEARAAATVLLGVMGRREDVPLLVDALLDPDLETRSELALSLVGRAAVDPLLQEAKVAPGPRRASVLPIAESLAGPESKELLETARSALEDPNVDVIVSALKVLQSRGTASDIERVAKLASHDAMRVAAAAAAALHGMSKRHPDAARALLAKIEPDGELAIAGCALVAALGADTAWPARALAAGDARTRRAAIDALASMPSAASREAVALALADENREVQLAAVRGLGKMGCAESLAELLAMPRDGELAAAALRAVGEIDADRAEALAFSLVTSADPAIACAAVEALSKLGASRREDGLIAALEHADPGVVTVAISALARDPTTRAIVRLGTCLDHDSWEVRRVAAETLGNIDDSSIGPLLRARLNREDNPGVREALQWALSARREDG